MSFYSYKNANTDGCPGRVSSDICRGLNEKICIQVKNVYDSCMQQEQLDDVCVTVTDIVPVLPSCDCKCGCSKPTTYDEAVENAENSNCPLPQPVGQWTFESCRSSSTTGTVRNLSIDRLCDRPQFARVKGTVDIPIDVLFVDACCQEWMGHATVSVAKDVLLAIPDESIIPFTLESLVSAICVTGTYMGNCCCKITVCVTIVLKILAEVELMVPSYGFCQIPPCEEFAENVCDEFFSLPLFPQQTCTSSNCTCTPNSSGSCNNNCTKNCSCNCGNNCTSSNNCGCNSCSNGCGSCVTHCVCSHCGTACGCAPGSLCPRCGCTMTSSC